MAMGGVRVAMRLAAAAAQRAPRQGLVLRRSYSAACMSRLLGSGSGGGGLLLLGPREFSSAAAAAQAAPKPVEADLFGGSISTVSTDTTSASPPATPEPGPVAAEAFPSGETTAVRLTENAIKRLHLLQKHDKPAVLRLTVNSGGCSGYQYDFELETEADARDDDVVVQEQGALFKMDPISHGFMEDSEIDYIEEMIRASFQVSKNKQAEANCSCGHSFNVAAF